MKPNQGYRAETASRSLGLGPDAGRRTSTTPRFSEPVSYTHLDVYKRQVEELIALMQAQSRAANERLVGSIQEILVEGGDGDGRVWGRTRSHLSLIHI